MMYLRALPGVYRVKEDMMAPRTIITALCAAALTLASTFGGAAAQDYPNKPIELMVAFPAGGSTDAGARIVAGIAEKMMGQPIIVLNTGGAGGQVGWTEMARQKPDGYFIGYINLPALNTVILDPERQAIFDVNDFTPIINQVLDPGVMWVKADSPYKTVNDVLDAAKAKPNTVRAVTTGILSDDHLALLMVEEAAPGVVFRIIHLAGGAEELKAILAGDADVAFDNVGSIAPRVESGEVRALAVFDEERSKFLPDVPTMKELGYPTVISSSTRGIAGPAGMPEPVVAKLTETFEKAMQDPEHIARLEEQGLAIKIMTGEEYANYYKNIHEQAKKYVEWAKSRPKK
jgi:tripartite-type tricarboxylate transporter receptor subunit TctC